VDVGAPSVAPSAHANRAGASGEVDVVDDGTHAAGGVAASEWLAANLCDGVVQVVQVPVFARTRTHRMTMMTTTKRASSKLSLADRLVNVRTRPSTRMG